MARSSYRAAGLVSVAALAMGWAGGAQAQAPIPTLEALQQQLAEQARLLQAQQTALDLQRAQLERLMQAAAITDDELLEARGAGQARSAPSDAPIQLAAAPLAPITPVGEPKTPDNRVEVAALPENAGVLTRRGHFVVEPSIEYTHGSSNRLVFRGVEIVTGVQIGVIEASDADRNAVSGAVGVRYGLTDRLEIEARVPYVYRSDRLTTLTQRETAATQTMSLKGQALGDVELAARYQVNTGQGGLPVFLLGMRVKSDTGASPFEVDRDEFGIAKELAIGSGFWGVDTSLTFLYPSDPVVIFGSLNYLAHLPKDINRVIGGVRVGEVDPGDSIGASLGFGFALNPRFSISMGYKHNYVFETSSQLGDTEQTSTSLQVGGFTFGLSYRLNDRMTISNNYEIGTTSDAPDMRVMFRLPIQF